MSKSSGSALVDFLMTRCWALHEPVLQDLAHVVFRHAEGGTLAAGEVADIVGRRDRDRDPDAIDSYAVHGDTAVIPITGIIAKHASMVNGSSKPRGTSVEAVSAQLKSALADKDVARILFAVDSPGGAVDGVAALGDEIFAARGRKPMTALADGTMASAAYWLASQADRVYATKDAVVGSIGCYAVVADKSRQTKNEGVDVTLVSSGKLKGAGAGGSPMTAEAVQNLQGIVSGYGEFFQGAVARGRAMSAEAVAGVADGRVWFGEQARGAGLIDGVASMSGLLGTPYAAGGVAAGPRLAVYGTDRSPEAFVPLPDGRSIPVTIGQNEPCRFVFAKPGEPIPYGNFPGQKHASEQGPGRATGAASKSETKPMADQPNGAPAVAATVTRESLPPQLAQDLRAEGAQAERTRISAIRELGSTGQETLVEALIAKGASADAAMGELFKDLKARNGTMLDALKRAAPPSAGNDDREFAKYTEGRAGPVTKDQYLAKAKEAFAKDGRLAAEFGDEKTYAGWLEATARGAVKGIANLPRSV